MTTYRVSWSEGGATVSTPAEVEAVLDHIAAGGGGAFLVHLWPEADEDAGVELVWGDSARAMLMYTDTDGEAGGWAVEPGVPLASRDLDYDHGSIEPVRTRLSAKAARAAVAEFVATGQRPTCVTWQE
jgi:hypothetical protein